LYVYRKIRAPEFTEFAADTILGSCGECLIAAVKLQNLLGTKFNTYAASFAPFSVYIVFL